MTFLVTGCGRSGTGWAAKFFTELGYPCGHEKLYTPVKHGPLTANESSWLAVPFLEELPEDTRVVRIVRYPFETIASSVARGFLKNSGPYDQFVKEHRPDITRPSDHLGRVIRYTALWGEPLEDRADLVFRIDFADVSRLGELFTVATGDDPGDNVREVRDKIGTRVNAGPVKKNLVMQILSHPDAKLIKDLMERCGY